ncbi:putative bifunctional diguanylate cyclase/phosphodiesterase [Amphritea balenae]|uniref:cyclic-guanylate-specific phosphodiesterase n=1 Tax=Amphritea balenae TaxID=452629 RepID=A0A3P1SY67_9GAMM|nr:EAL domain-containing protein [Amphritea balenae]RRD01496.1 EAL domain-containing protein [Amphritea balenae]GGK56571.1 hypothetical protein GCM10007941_03440 [Amphritea balenae]
MGLSRYQHSFIYASLLTLLLISTGVYLNSSKISERIDLIFYDLMLPFHATEMSNEIVIIAIDNNSLEQLGRWPWSRSTHAALINKLTEYKAAAVGIDILFPDPQQGVPKADTELAEAILKNGRVALSVAPDLLADGMMIELLPLPELALGAAAIGHVDIELDQDGRCRRVFLYSGINDTRWPTLTLAMLEIAGRAPSLPIKQTQLLQSSEHWNRSHSMLIPFASRTQTPTIISWADITNGFVNPEQIAGKYVLIGATAAGLGDAFATPAAEAHQRMSGVELNAHILNALLQGRAIQPLTPLNQQILSGIITLLCAAAVFLLPLRSGLFSSLVLIISTPLISLALLQTKLLWFPPTAPLIPLMLIWPVWSFWQLSADAQLRRQLQQQLEHQTRHHKATGLPNSSMLTSRLRQLAASEQHNDQITGLMVIHFDWPGSAGTTLGRPIADDLLKAIGERLKTVTSDADFIAHMNGDDFAILLDKVSKPDLVLDSAFRLLNELQAPLQLNQEYLLLSPQIGVSLWPGEGHNGVGLLRNAYTAMFKSRIDDSEQLCIYSADLGKQVKIRSQMEQALIHAIERNEFEVYYQPQIKAGSGKIVGVEALLRWHNPTLGWISPATFIPVAEHVGLIRTIGYWILTTACQQLQQWQTIGLPSLRLAVNVSPLQFADPDLTSSIQKIIKDSGINPAQLELEITEGSLMWDMDRAIKVMKKIKHEGVDLAIDDFGTGYSSLSNLRHFPLDRLKIDQSFTREIGKNKDATEITLTILTMAKRLGMRIIAEGVETAEQASFLRKNGCDEFQGFLYSRAVPADQITQLLSESQDSSKHPML